jgi:hypothetical protein
MSGWHFINLPKGKSSEITLVFGERSRGFGSLPVDVTIGKTTWKTSIFPDKKSGTYVLPLKAPVRKKEDIRIDDLVDIAIELLV